MICACLCLRSGPWCLCGMRGFHLCCAIYWSSHYFTAILIYLSIIFSPSFPANVSEMAIVPYDSSAVFLSSFHAKERSFEFGGRTLTIFQNWNDVGVAAVVWDAAIVLGRYLEKIAAQLHGKKVIELGAGTGFAGIVVSFC